MRIRRILIFVPSVAVLVLATVLLYNPRPPARYRLDIKEIGPCPYSWIGQVYVNDFGQITGICTLPTPPTPESISPAELESIAGPSNMVQGTMQSFLWDPNSEFLLLKTTPGAQSIAQAINNRGQVAGAWFGTDGTRHACVWDRTGERTDLASDNIARIPTEINNLGHVIGYGGTRFTWVFYWDRDSGIVEIKPAGQGQRCFVSAINDADCVVGRMAMQGGTTHAFVWTPSSGITDLHAAFTGYTCSGAEAINDVGWVLVDCWNLGSTVDRYLYRPSDGAKRQINVPPGRCDLTLDDRGRLLCRTTEAPLTMFGGTIRDWKFSYYLIESDGTLSTLQAPVFLGGAHLLGSWRPNSRGQWAMSGTGDKESYLFIVTPIPVILSPDAPMTPKEKVP